LLELVATASHAGNAGSNPAGITKKLKASVIGMPFYFKNLMPGFKFSTTLFYPPFAGELKPENFYIDS
jgi:hypothetical protein